MAIDEKFDVNALARQYGEHYEIPQQKDELDSAYRSRVAGELRRQGNVIEAHEVFSGRRHDDPNQGPTGPMAGIFGAVAQAMQGREYSPDDPERRISNDIAAGVIVRSPPDPTKEAISTLFGALGPSAGMDLIDSKYKGKK